MNGPEKRSTCMGADCTNQIIATHIVCESCNTKLQRGVRLGSRWNRFVDWWALNSRTGMSSPSPARKLIYWTAFWLAATNLIWGSKGLAQGITFGFVNLIAGGLCLAVCIHGRNLLLGKSPFN